MLRLRQPAEGLPPIEATHVDEAKEVLIARRDTHLDSLIERLREPRVERVLSPILAGELTLGDRIDDDIAYTEDLGLVDSGSGGGTIHREYSLGRGRMDLIVDWPHGDGVQREVLELKSVSLPRGERHSRP